MFGLKCGYSEVDCPKCEKNPDCKMYSERYVLRKDLKILRKRLQDTLTILNAILGGE